jgi:hypothetical protein
VANETGAGNWVDAYRQARPDRYLGEHETYGTFPQWVEGEGVSDLFPAGTEGFGLRPTYINPVTEAIAEHPLTNIFTGGREMLRQGSSGPTISDWAMLGLSVIPGANVAARPVVSNIAGRYAKWLESANTGNPYGLINRTKMNLRHNRLNRDMRRDSEAWAMGHSDDVARLAESRAEHDAWMLAHKARVQANRDQLYRDIDELKGSGSRLAEAEGKSLTVVPEKIPMGGDKIIKKTYTGENASRYGKGPYAYLSNPKDPDLPVIYVGSALADYARMLNANVILKNPPSVKDVLSMKARDFYALDRKMQDRLLENAGINRELWSYNVWIREGRDEIKAVIRVSEKKGNDALAHKSRELMHNYDRQIAALTDDQLELIGIGNVGEFGNVLKTLTERFKDLPPPAGSNIVKFEQRKFGHTPRIPESSLPVGELPTAKPITDMTWREWDALYKPGMDVSDSQRALLRVNKEFKTADDVVAHFWDTGAREEYFGYLNQMVRDGKSIPDNLLEFVRATDKKTKFPFKWNEIPYQNDSSVAALKHSFKPSHVDAKDWAKLTQFLDKNEVIDLARRMTLRLM